LLLQERWVTISREPTNATQNRNRIKITQTAAVHLIEGKVTPVVTQEVTQEVTPEVTQEVTQEVVQSVLDTALYFLCLVSLLYILFYLA
jgi:hypothetical protein